MKEAKQFDIVPEHIAFIMDGNRRWAVKHGLNKMMGHRKGADIFKAVVKSLSKIKGVKFASFFAFSTENWNRDPKEVNYIFDLVRELVGSNQDYFVKYNVKFNPMGDISRFDEDLQDMIKETVEKTKNNSGLVLNLAINYGGRDDIVHAVNTLIKKGVKEITVDNLKENLYSYPAPDIDLMVRTSGELRISNFMLFQLAYAELYFTEKNWPEFTEKELFKAIEEFGNRNRRFGGK